MSQILCIRSGQVDSEQIQEAQRKFQVLTMQTLCKSLDEYLKINNPQRKLVDNPVLDGV